MEIVLEGRQGKEDLLCLFAVLPFNKEPGDEVGGFWLISRLRASPGRCLR